MTKDHSIPRRNKVNWHYVRDDQMFTTIKLVSRHQNTQQFDAMLPVKLTNADIRNSEAYKEYYAVATGATPPKTKASVQKTKSSSDTTVTPPPTAAAGTRLFTSTKGKQPAKAYKAKSLTALSEVAMTEAKQFKLATKKSLQQTHISQASGLGADEGTGEDDDDNVDEGSDDQDDDDDREEGDDDDDQEEGNDDDQDYDEEGEEFIHPREEGQDEEDDEDELYRDVNINLEGRDVQMADVHTTQEYEDSCDPNSVAPLPLSAPTPPTTASSTLLQDLPNFGSLFGFDHQLKTLEANFSEFMQTNQFVRAVSSIPEIVQRYMDQQMNEAVKTVNDQLEAKVLTRSSNSSKTSYAVAADLLEMELKKILIKKMEDNKSIHRFNEQRNLYKALVEAYESDKIILDTYGDTGTLKRHLDDDADKDEEPSARSDRGSAGKSTQGFKSQQTSACEFATAEETMHTTHEIEEPSHPEIETAFLMNRLKVDTLTPELLAVPTYKLMKGSCKSLVELEFFLEEVYKATTDQLDRINLEGKQYPHNMLKPLPLISNSRGRRVIPFDHFINNDLEYLCGGASSRKYTTSVTKTKAANYRHIKWIEDLVPWIMWIQEPVGYNKHALWGISHWGIIAVTELKILEWHNYKHLDWIIVRRDDDKLYKFKEGNFKRLRIQDIEDMLLLLVQGKLTNLTVEERFTFNVSFRMFTRSIVIQRRVEDLQLGVKSYQKKLKLTRLDMYYFDLKRKEAYIAYSNPRGFIYQNKDKQNRLIRIDELHKFSDGTLIDVRTALDDRLKGIRMKYLPQTIWRKSDKERAAAMIQAIDK
uniref:Uncharacterized protein n=1 Tax=Tanacetum cinerariifolium TaxID=118510 RepID=A0A6L2JQX6_TANCI|nr:hypothetical protein [Tanacetum cinerariifolium]